MSSSGAKIALVFPGQGSQAVGMGQEVYQRSRRARAVFHQADEALGFPLSRLCFYGPVEELKQTVNAQPAILTVSLAYLYSVMEGEGREDLHPAFVAGHSLGEYTALVMAGALELPEAVRLVRERGRLMQEAGLRQPGGMAAILGLDDVTVNEVCRETGAEIANVNSPGQIVISGSRRALARAMDLARARGARRTIPLEVSGAFHSSLMRPALEGLARALGQTSFQDPAVPLVANATARALSSAQEIKEELLCQIYSCVQWRQSVELMIQQGISTFVETGPGQVLSGLIRRIGPEVQSYSLAARFEER